MDEQLKRLSYYFGSLEELYKITNLDVKLAARLIALKNLKIKKYSVLKKPLRTRKIIHDFVSDHGLKLIECATAISFNVNDTGKVVSLSYCQEQIKKKIRVIIMSYVPVHLSHQDS